MSINICETKYGTKIFCSHPSSEFRHASQLLCNNQKLESGYLAESFVKPPVYIVISWQEHFKVHKITFQPSYGRHTISKMCIRCLTKKDIKSPVNDDNFRSIIEAFKYSKPDILINFSLSDKSNAVEINFLAQYAPSKSNYCIYNLIRKDVVLVILEIISMKDTSLPCLSNLRIYSAIKRKQVFVTTKNNNHKEIEKSKETEEIKECSTDDRYPDDCVDPVTAELLTHPVKLPCGTYINITTLHKFWSTKSKHAPKYNPFTMVPLNKDQIDSVTVIDEIKRAEVATKVRENRQRQQDIYNALINPKKKYVPIPFSSNNDSDSDNEDRLAAKLNANFYKNFAFLLNKNP